MGNNLEKIIKIIERNKNLSKENKLLVDEFWAYYKTKDDLVPIFHNPSNSELQEAAKDYARGCLIVKSNSVRAGAGDEYKKVEPGDILAWSPRIPHMHVNHFLFKESFGRDDYFETAISLHIFVSGLVKLSDSYRNVWEAEFQTLKETILGFGNEISRNCPFLDFPNSSDIDDWIDY